MQVTCLCFKMASIEKMRLSSYGGRLSFFEFSQTFTSIFVSICLFCLFWKTLEKEKKAMFILSIKMNLLDAHAIITSAAYSSSVISFGTVIFLKLFHKVEKW